MWLAGWKYRRKITINNSLAYGLSDYQVWIPTGAFGSQWTAIRSSAQPTMADFRFTPTTAAVSLPYWIDSDTTTPNGFRVKISTILAGNNTIYMYYGNASSVSTSSGPATFLFFDDFESGLGKWTIGGTNFTIETVPSPWRLRIYRSVVEIGFGGVNSIDTFSKASIGDFVLTFNDLKYTLNNEGNNFRAGLVDSSFGPTDNVDGRCAYARYETGVNMFTTHAGASPQNTSLSITWGATSRDIDFVFRGTAASMICDGVTQANHTTVADATLEIYINNEKQVSWEEIFVNDIYVRKYAPTEPTISSVGSEEGSFFSTGSYRSAVIDTASKVVLSSISWNPSSQPAGTNIAVGIRVSSYTFSINSSTPAFVAVSNGQQLNWPGRYIQYQSTFTTTNSTSTPRLEDMTITYRVKPWQEKIVTRTPPNSSGFGGGETWEWEVPVKSGSALTITAYIRYNSEYGGSTTKPKLTLSGKGISPTSISATSSAENAWELLTINAGTPSQNATLTLRAEGFSAIPNAKFYIDDVNISQ